MVKTCCVYNCRNRANYRAKSNSISFFRFPANRRKLQAWIKAVNRKDWEPNAHTHVYSEHFVSGWHSDDPNDINYAPTLFIRQKRKERKKTKQEDGPDSFEDTEIIENFVEEELHSVVTKDVSQILDLSVHKSSERPQGLTDMQSYPSHLRDHQYYRLMPWPGKKQKSVKSQSKLSRESAAETLLLLAHVCEPDVSSLDKTVNTDDDIENLSIT